MASAPDALTPANLEVARLRDLSEFVKQSADVDPLVAWVETRADQLGPDTVDELADAIVGTGERLVAEFARVAARAVYEHREVALEAKACRYQRLAERFAGRPGGRMQAIHLGSQMRRAGAALDEHKQRRREDEELAVGEALLAFRAWEEHLLAAFERVAEEAEDEADARPRWRRLWRR